VVKLPAEVVAAPRATLSTVIVILPKARFVLKMPIEPTLEDQTGPV
jgi:hypothetical protein